LIVVIQNATTTNKPTIPLDSLLVKRVMRGLFIGDEVDLEKPKIVRIFTSSTFTGIHALNNTAVI
jgi:hypothetical protein